MATVKLTIGSCRHVHVDITHDGATERRTLTKADFMTPIQEDERPIDIIIANLKTYYRKRKAAGKTLAEIKAEVDGKEFEI